MNIHFPSPEFDDAVAAVCHGLASDEQARALNELLRQDTAARDDYILRVELHSRLASQPELFVPGTAPDVGAVTENNVAFPSSKLRRSAPRVVAKRKMIWGLGLAACLALLAVAGWQLQRLSPTRTPETPVVAAPASDWKPSVTNLPGQDYPRINSERRAQFRIEAPDADSVSVNIASMNMGAPLTVTKSEDGVWTITTSPLGIGFHFYRVNIDGASLADPATQIFSGGGGDWLSSAIEVPTGEDFHERKNVPHGEVREQKYFSGITDSERRAFVYTPPDYDRNPSARYPVLYLLHGRGEDETCWPTQGRVSQILDNLIAEQKARPMIVVMDRGVARRPGEPDTSSRSSADGGRFATLNDVFVTELIPMIDRMFRTVPDREHRALGGLSLGGAQAFAIGFRHLDQFAYLAGFSGAGGSGRGFDPGTAYGGLMADANAFNRRMRVLFVSAGADEPEGMLSRVEQYHQRLQAAGINHVFYQSPGTGHEWHTWRRSLREFASLLFKD
jgi:enterochelin esterase-like enzyme